MMQMDPGKLFIGGISWDTNEERLKEYFCSYGEIQEVVIMKYPATGRSRGFGFIVFTDPDIANQVIKEKHQIDGRMVEAKHALPRDEHTNTTIMCRQSGSIQSSPGPIRKRKIFVGGLASTVTENEFKHYFEQFGTVTNGVLMYNHNTQRPRGFGFITYDSEDVVDKVLLQRFHELNGKMVEVKRAIPKDLFAGPIRSPLSACNYCLNGISNFLSGYNQEYSPSAIAGYGMRMDNRFSPITVVRGGFPPFGSGYGMSLNIEASLSPYFCGNTNFNSTTDYGRGIYPYYIDNSNRFTNSLGFDGGNGGNTSFFSSITQNLWNNGGLNSTNSSGYLESGRGSIGGVTFANSGLNLGSSPTSHQGGRRENIPNQGGNMSNGCADNTNNLGGVGYGRNTATTPQTSSNVALNVYDAPFADFYGSSSIYEDSMWRAADFERDAGAFGYGLGSRSSNVQFKTSPDYVGDSISKGQKNKGITI